MAHAICCLRFWQALSFQAWRRRPGPVRIARMKSEYRRPPPLPVKNPALVELGRELFFDPQTLRLRQDGVRDLSF